MATKQQSEAMNLYANLMEEIKVRIAAIDAGTSMKLALPPPIIKEHSYLQLRLICEVIALGCIAAHGDLTQTKKIRKEWAADKIIEELEKLHPDFFPRQIRKHRTEFGFHVEPVAGCMNKEELVALYHECGDILHKGSIKKLLKPQMPIQISYPEITKRAQRILDLLSEHIITTLDGNLHFLCLMSAANVGGRVQVAIAEAPSPSENTEWDAKWGTAE